MTYKYRIVELKRRETGHDWSDDFLAWMKKNHPLVEIPSYDSRWESEDDSSSFDEHLKLFHEEFPKKKNYKQIEVPGYYYVLERRTFWWTYTGMQDKNKEKLKEEIASVMKKMKEQFEDKLHHKVVEEFDLEVKIDKTARYY